MFALTGDGKARTMGEIIVDVTNVPGVTHIVRVPEGYPFDGASIPRWGWPIAGHPFSDDLLLPACVHDWYCDHALTYHDRVIGDNVFLKLLHDVGVSWWRRAGMYVVIRLNTFLRWRHLG